MGIKKKNEIIQNGANTVFFLLLFIPTQTRKAKVCENGESSANSKTPSPGLRCLSLSPRLVCFCPLSFRDLPDSSAQVTRFRRKRLAELMNEMHVARSLSTRGRGRSLGSSPCAFLGTRATYGHSSYKFKRLRDYFFFALSYVTR